MVIRRLAVVFLLGLSGAVHATELNLSIVSSGNSTIMVEGGQSFPYDVQGVLSDSLNQGLALVIFDLSFTGGALNAAAAPVSAPMSNFVRPLGVTNPAGYGGTPIGGNLVQAGGAQNTIKNTVLTAPFPLASVITGVAWPPAAVTIVSGAITAPVTPGIYSLSLSNIAASVIRDGETGAGAFWAVDQIGTGTIGSLTIEVLPAFVEPTIEALGSRYLQLNGGEVATPFAYLITPQCAGSTPKYVGAPSGLHNVARLVNDSGSAAFFTNTQWGLVRLTGPDIVPGLTYDMQANTGTVAIPNLLPPVSAATWAFGELNNLGEVDVDDLICMLDAFAETGCSLFVADIAGIDPGQVVDVDDLIDVLSAFSGGLYPGPSPCP